ncbi:NAD(P)H-hydrate dehydratase [Janthinobacterium sp.]|uniref:NAD(P)H-hydrate dehydratase n=1 Tax=Janthinobacterium sp. TaxID=1871054 RepID=UPI00293D1D4D|nr:NAD(P)H-hydrate dehydratase [Janthinobacterium sp.]
MNSLYSVAEIRAIEESAATQLPRGALMQRAGQAGANAALDLLPLTPSHCKVLVLAGPGNNGGDALETAAHLAHAGMQVSVWLVADAGAPSAERQHALQRARGSAARFVEADAAAIAAEDWNLIIDGLFGIGLRRPLEGALRAAVEQINALERRVLALDLPSGLDADTGAVVGPDGVAVRASHTITFIGDKPGLHTCDGQDYAGTVLVSRLELDASHFPPAAAHLNEVRYFSRHLRARRQNSHKGSYGSVAVIGGGHGMTGAPILAARSALHAGAGRVYIVFPDEAPAYDSGQPELMCRLASDFDLDSAVLVAGPGLGSTHRARDLLQRAIDSASALVLDADALNLMAAEPELQTALALRARGAVLTPHPLEAARLLGVDIAEVQADRLAAARQLAAQMRVTVVLKGSGTVIAGADGAVVVNATGNPALATAGTGDVLAGLCGSLLAQGWPEWEAALAAVWLHGMAADVLVADGVGPIGLTAGELLPAIRVAINRMAQHQRY